MINTSPWSVTKSSKSTAFYYVDVMILLLSPRNTCFVSLDSLFRK